MKRISLFAFLTLAPSIVAAQGPLLVGMGDSIGEAVQSGEASARNQRVSYINVVARQMGAEMPLPLIDSSPLGFVSETARRRRIDPTVESLNTSVSGADVSSILRRRADAATPEEIDSETDLVLFPRQASQIEIVEALRPEFVACWIGNNDVLSAAISFDELDASQMTSVASFRRDFRELADRLAATNAKVVFGNIPDVTTIGFLMNGETLRRFTGRDFGLPERSYTSLPVMMLLRLGLGRELLEDPNFVLDASEVARIQERTGVFNAVIEEEAARIGAAVVDVHRWLGLFTSREVKLLGVRLGPGFLDGLLSLDGVHPSHLGHAIVAGLFLAKMNAHFGTSFPLPSLLELARVFLTDPFVDKDGDLRVRGMPLNGALETFGPLLGISGDLNDFRAGPRPSVDPARGRRFMRLFRARQGIAAERLDAWSEEDAVEAMRWLFGTDRLAGSRQAEAAR